MLDRSSTRYVLLVYLSDILMTMVALLTANRVRPILPFGQAFSEPGGITSVQIYVWAIVIWSLIFVLSSAYDPRRMVLPFDEIQVVSVSIFQSTLVLAGVLYFTFRGVSRLLFATFFVFDLVFVLAARMIIRAALKGSRTPNLRGQRVLIIGTNSTARSLGARLAELAWMGLDLVGFVSEDSIAPNGPQAGANGNGPPNTQTAESSAERSMRILGRMQDVPELVQQYHVGEVVIALPLYAHPELPNIVALLERLPVNIKVVPDLVEMAFLRSTVEELGGIPLIGIKEPVISLPDRVVKRLLDIVIASVGLILLAPVMVIVAILIRLDSPGPILFRQQRVGQGERLFWMYKLRTMVANAPEQQGTLMSRDEHGNLIFEKRPDDPRVTRVGRYLRRLSLDEVPQLINVLKGEMSLVGPRPELPVIVQNYEPWQRKRFAVPPGMTGWWQIRGRSQQPMHLRTEDDLYYLRNYSLRLDLLILWKTIGAVISGRGAF